MKPIRGSRHLKITISKIDVHIAEQNYPPFTVQATVVEQDTSLILEPDEEIRDPGADKPVWYLANILEYQPLHKPGEVIYKPGKPIKFWAVVHDLEQTPSWHSQWIDKALKNILELCEKKNIVSVCLPVLGSQFGHFKITEFILLLVKALKTNNPVTLKHIWLIVPDKERHAAFTMLKKISSIERI